MLGASLPVWGSVPGWLTLLGVLAVLVTFVRGGSGSGEAIKSIREARDVLNETVEEQRKKLDESNKEIATLQGKTDVTLALMTTLGPMEKRAQARMELHEKRAQERHEGQMIVLDLIAKRLGPEKEEE